MNPFEGVLDLVTQVQVQQKAEQAIFQTKTREAMLAKEEATAEQQRQLGIAAEAQARDTQAVAEGVADITSTLKADPTDPESLMARNNVAITALNEQLLNQFNAIDTVQQDSSFVGQLQKMFTLPELLAGADQITAQRGQFINANATLHSTLANQTAQVKQQVELADTEKALADQRAAAAGAMAGMASDKLKTAADFYRIQAAAGHDTMQVAIAVADSKVKMMRLPVELAIMRNELVKFEQQQEADAMITEFAGHPAGSAARFLATIKNNPQAYNALANVVIDGKVHTPFDAELLAPYMNRKALTRPDGTVAPQLAIIDEMRRPVIAARVNALEEGLRASMVAKQMTGNDIEKVFNNRGALKQHLDTYMGALPKSTAHPSDAINWNPAQIYNAVPGLKAVTPLIAEVVGNSGNATQDIAPEHLAGLVVKSNMDKPAPKIAQELATYYQTTLAFDKQRPVYNIAGIPPPNEAKIKVERMGIMQKFSAQQASFVKGAGAGAQLARTTFGSGAKRKLDLTNAAEWEDYIKEVQQKAKWDMAQ